MPQIMSRPVNTDITHDIDTDRFLTHLNATHTPQTLAKHVIVNDQAFQTEPQKRGMHARRLIDHVQTGQSRHHKGAALFIARLCIRHLGIRHACSGTARKPIMLQHLGTAGRQQPLLTRSARHGPGPQIRYKWPGADNAGMPRHHRVHIDQPGNDFGQCLCHGPGDGSWRGGTGLPG